MRKSISKKLRFGVFKRDAFTCQYCGNTPPSVILEVDHIHPVSKGGLNETDNLITACFDCNRGKGADELHVSPETIEKKRELLEERELQLAEFEKLTKNKRKRERLQIDEIEGVLSDFFEGSMFTPRFRISIKRFVEKLPQHELLSAMEISCSRTSKPDDAARYFCGICWNKIKGLGS